MEENNQPKHDEISELKVFQSRAGYYVGRQQYDQEMEAWIPHNRISSYMNKRDHAENLLEKANEFKKEIDPISRGNLRVFRNDLTSKLNDHPDNELKRNLISDQLENGKKPEKKIEKPYPMN